jgi:hypothetical protein
MSKPTTSKAAPDSGFHSRRSFTLLSRTPMRKLVVGKPTEGDKQPAVSAGTVG